MKINRALVPFVTRFQTPVMLGGLSMRAGPSLACSSFSPKDHTSVPQLPYKQSN